MTSNLRKHLAVAAGVAVLLATGTATASARPAHAPSPAQQLQRDVAAIHALGISGVQARTVGPDGRSSVATAGTADLRTGRPVSPDGYFRMASTSKTLIATVVLQLEAEGRLSLDDPVGRWLPDVPWGKDYDPARITLRDLLQHTGGISDAGLPGYRTAKEYDEQRFLRYSSEELVARAMNQEPAKGWSYSNTGYVMLSLVIERATGRPSHLEVEDRVLRPLGLSRTRWTGTTPTLPRPHARAYEFYGPGAEKDVTVQVPVSSELSWVTTTRDENAFFRALLSGRLLPARQLAAMKDGVDVSGNPQAAAMWPKGTRYGLGLVGIPLDCGGGRTGTYWSHEGGDGGYITLNGVTGDGRRSAVVSMSEARGDSLEHVVAQEKAAEALIEHALCGAGD
ncbi:D-alanyl-D-alanine carboxypeptidase [Kitasatospora xanthocidica]|uniref:serine hydrolase domain-containing protein n=1 Tax=Kitasatospora xanthocidica TaxID=83382 RepID=UPI00167610F2|nr:serine hydrolase domain-containing protein [Kitasatospora xanthocidica]GHF82080.1 D-alanyl-D-alanine carboxypeptidase [Kitasatospora xanthocidica]